jgi:hypothetical protein
MCLIKQKVEPILKKSVKALLEQQNRHGCWSFPAHLGSHYISLYALFLEWLRFRGFSSRLDLNRLATILMETQLADGSWKQARDPAIPSGDINATVLNYAALKFFKSSISTANVQPAMEAAREFILAAGGIDATNQFTKTFLALFGLRGWEDLSEIPYLIFLEVLPLNYRQFSQWVIPHLIPMACLRHNRVSPKIRGTFGPELDLGELYAGQSWQSHEKENEPSALGRPLGHQHALWHHPGRNGASAGRRIAAIALSPHSRSDADEFSKSRWRLQQRKCMSNMGHCASD